MKKSEEEDEEEEVEVEEEKKKDAGLLRFRDSSTSLEMIVR